MTTKGKILIVDDDPVLRDLLVDTLGAIGYETEAASDGVEAMALLREQDSLSFDLLVTDIKMPNMDGLTLLKKIRRAYPHLPVLFVTGVVSEETMAAALPDGYLSKPFRIARLEELIENALAARHADHRPEPPRRVLINVREDNLRENLSETLSLSNYLPFAVAGGDEALEELERGRFDVVITGIEKTSTGTSRYLSRLREKHPALPVLLASSTCSAAEIKKAGDKFHASGYLSGSFRPGDLIALLDKTVPSSAGGSN